MNSSDMASTVSLFLSSSFFLNKTTMRVVGTFFAHLAPGRCECVRCQATESTAGDQKSDQQRITWTENKSKSIRCVDRRTYLSVSTALPSRHPLHPRPPFISTSFPQNILPHSLKKKIPAHLLAARFPFFISTFLVIYSSCCVALHVFHLPRYHHPRSQLHTLMVRTV